MLTETKQTCEELIDERMAGRFEHISPNFDNMALAELRAFCEEYTTDLPDDMVYAGPGMDEPYYKSLLETAEHASEALMDEDDEHDAWLEMAREIHRDHSHASILSIDYIKTAKVLFSTGGPEDYLEIQYDDSGIIGGRYFYKDWFDAANRYVEADKVEELVDAMGIYLDGLH